MKKRILKTETRFYLFLVIAICITILQGCKKDNNGGQNNPPPDTSKYIVSTVAGSSNIGAADGDISVATFLHPTGIAFDATGNIYIADAGNYRIRKISPAGIVSTLAGNANWGTKNGTGVAAGFTIPWGIVRDAYGTMYVTDDCTIRKITNDSVVSTLAGSSLPGYADGSGTNAKFGEQVTGIVLDASGNIFVVDQSNFCIRKITPTGVVSTLAGNGASGFADGTGTAAQFKGPWGIAIDGSGNIYVADRANSNGGQTVVTRKITPGGVVTTLYMTGGDTGPIANPPQPASIALDASGNIYVGDNSNDIILKSTPDGFVSRLAGSGIGFADGDAASAKFNLINGLAIDASGIIYVADFDNHRLRKITKQ